MNQSGFNGMSATGFERCSFGSDPEKGGGRARSPWEITVVFCFFL